MMKKWAIRLIVLSLVCTAGVARAKDLGDILLQKGLITPDELRQAREEEKQKTAAEESRREMLAAKLPKWLEYITVFGDMRNRYEGFYANDLNARNRYRLRARIGITSNVSDEIGGTIRLASGNPDDPITTNQSFERTFTRKSISLDQAYLTVRPGATFHIEPGIITLTAGKFGVNAYRVSELMWDDDLSPEGATETVAVWNRRDGFLRGVKLNAFQWIVDEVASAEDPWMWGGQVVGDAAMGSLATGTLAFGDYHYENLDDIARKFLNKGSGSFNGQLATSNSLEKDAAGNFIAYRRDFNVFSTSGELNFNDPAGLGIPAGIFGDLAYNTRADSENVGFALGVGIGKAGRDYYHNGLKNPGEWGVSYTYERVEKDAVLSLFSYSDLDYVQAKATQKGSTNLEAHILRLDYLLFPNFQLTAKAHFINALDQQHSTAALKGNSTLVRTQLDAVFKF